VRFELIISHPRILTKIPDTGKGAGSHYEEVTVDVHYRVLWAIVSALTGDRKGIMLEMSESAADGKTRLVFERFRSRALLGFNSELLQRQGQECWLTHIYIEDRPHAETALGLRGGKMVSNDSSRALAIRSPL
jgi:predicted membrane GTPase involved in stress response